MASEPTGKLTAMPATPGHRRTARLPPPVDLHPAHAGRSRTRASLHHATNTAVVAILTAVLVLALGGGQAYWLCVPAVLLTAAGCRSRGATAIVAAAIVAAAAVPAGLAHGWQTLPATPLLVLVPAASAAVLLAVRERLEAERDAMRRSALTDPLTGVANRRSFLSRTEYEISRHTRARRPFGVVMLDLDGFKQLNDRFGHPAGDDLLRDVAAAIAHAVRDQDTVARMGGDEFCVLAPETDLNGTQQLAGRIMAAVSGVTAGVDALGASAGVAVFPHDGGVTAALLEAADQRLLESKRRRGRHRPRRAA
jgi:diguanylate cyclase (GGDEF)-like protein